VDQARSTQRREPSMSEAEQRLRERIVELACTYGHYGYRRITGLHRQEAWRLNHKRVERIWRQEGLKVPQKQPRGRRLWLNDGSCIRLRPERKDHIWSCDFVSDRTSDGKALKMLTIIDEHTRECLAIHVARQITAVEVVEQLADLFLSRGIPEHLRSDNGSEFTAKIVRGWLCRLGVKTWYIEPGSP
jgi:putative transposase